MKYSQNKNEKYSREFFNKRALKYDREHIGKFTQQYKQLLIETIEETKSYVRGCKVLDVACGTGTLLKMLSEQYAVEGYGIDISENMVALAREKNKDFHIEVGSASDLYFVDNNSIDVVTVCAAYHHFPDTDQFLREVFRVLKLGGAIYIAEPHVPALFRPLMFIFIQLSKSGDKAIYTTKQIDKSFRKNHFIPQTVKIRNFIQICYAVKPEKSDNMEKYCQSCGMPFDEGHAELIAKEPDGSDSIYCSYCYGDGKFLQPDITLSEMVEIGVPHLGYKIGEQAAREQLSKFLPTLERWK